MPQYLTKKIIRESKKAGSSEKLTVSKLRSMVREKVKEANRIIADLSSDSKKGKYQLDISKQIQSGLIRESKTSEGFFTAQNVKYMRSDQLMSAYNELTAFVETDTQSAEYAKRLRGREEKMRRKTQDAIGRKISRQAYTKMVKMWQSYGSEVDMYGYNELFDLAESTGKNESLHDALVRGEKALEDMGVPVEKGKVLKYLKNEEALRESINDISASNPEMEPAQVFNTAMRSLGRQ